MPPKRGLSMSDISVPEDMNPAAGGLPGHTYRAFGLHIRSCLPCPELVPIDRSPDVTVRYGPVPDSLESPTSKGVCYQASPGKFLLRLKEIAGYLVLDGREIIVEPARGAADDDIRLFLLGSVLGALLHQRGLLPLHGSAVRLGDGSAAVFAGCSGVGKSTLAAALRRRGYPVVADDLSVVRTRDDGVSALQPAYPELRLWADAAAKVGEAVDTLPKSRAKLEKYSLCFHERFDDRPLPVRRFYVLETGNTPDFRIARLKGTEKMEVLSEHTFRKHFVNALGQTPAHFRHCAALASNAVFSRVTRPKGAFLLDNLVSLLEKDFA